MLVLAVRAAFRAHRSPFLSSPGLVRSLQTMAAIEIDAIQLELDQHRTLFNDLRKQNASSDILDQAKKKLGDLQKSLALAKGAAGSKDAGKKRERLMLKTAKVLGYNALLPARPHFTQHPGFSSRRVRVTTAPPRCIAGSTSSGSSRSASRCMAGAALTRPSLSGRTSSRASTARTRSSSSICKIKAGSSLRCGMTTRCRLHGTWR